MAKAIKKSLEERIRQIKAVCKRKKRQAQMRVDQKLREIEEMRVMDRSMLRERIVSRLAGGRKEGGKRVRVLREEELREESKGSIVTLQKFSCPICMEIMLEPRLTPCGHAFCRPCIQQSLMHKNACSLCREAINFESPSESKFLKRMVEGVVEKLLGGEQAEQHERRKRQYSEKMEKRALMSEIKEGYKLDFYCEGKWMEGKVKLVQKMKERTILTISSVDSQHTRKLPSQSPLLAKLHTFTRESHTNLYASFQQLHRSDFSGLFDFDFDESLHDLLFFDFSSPASESGSVLHIPLI